MQWERMTIEEYAGFRREEGMKVEMIDGVWWAEVRPFFFRPLFPFMKIDPGSRRYPSKSLIGGFLHAVPEGLAGNATMNFFVYDKLQEYALEQLSPRRRRITQQGLGNFSAREITDLAEFVETAYQVYLSFFQRTNYWYQNDRVDQARFRLWAEKLYRNPRVAKIGAYRNGRLCAVETSFRVEDVIFGDHLFSDRASLNLKVTDFIMHILRQTAAVTDAKYLFVGLPSGVHSLDQSKLIRGCQLLTVPAYCKINPLALSVAKVFMKQSYRKLLQITDPDASALHLLKSKPAETLFLVD